MIFQLFKRNFSNQKAFHYVTTPIFYVNAEPHIGHLYTTVLTDAINRYEKLKNPTKKCILTTGTDEHGTKIQQAAGLHKVSVENYCNRISKCYQDVFNLCNVEYSNFIRTSEQRHMHAAQTFWNLLKSKGNIYSSQYSGWYCVSDETFLTETQLKTNPDGSKVSIESGHAVEWTEEINYMFPLSKFQNDIINWIKGKNRIKPNNFEKILLESLNEPLPDISISRPISRVHWGIPVPDDPTQTIYVWLDALINYLTCAGYPDKTYNKLWPPTVQVIGKDILKFHGIYWPAFLIAADIEPPSQLFVHSHWTVNNEKMSKSKFNVVDPFECSKMYTMEGLRYFLLREGVAHNDGNYSETKLRNILNSELADTLGNLLSRGCAKTLNPRQIYPKIHNEQLDELYRIDATKRLFGKLEKLPDICKEHYDSYNFYLVVDQVMSTLHAANNFFETCKPWELTCKKNSSSSLSSVAMKENSEKLETIISITFNTLRICGIILQPIIPQITKKLLDKLCIPVENRLWKDIENSSNNHNSDATAVSAKNAILLNIPAENNNEKLLSTTVDAVLFRRIVLKNEKDKTKVKKNQ